MVRECPECKERMYNQNSARQLFLTGARGGDTWFWREATLYYCDACMNYFSEVSDVITSKRLRREVK